jgi:acetyl esterase
MTMNHLVLDPVVRHWLRHLESRAEPPIYEQTPAEGRNSLLQAQATYNSKADARSEDVTVTVETGPLDLRIIRPSSVAGPCPAVLYFHGGGWVLGDAETHDRLVRDLAVRTDAAVVFVDYYRAPEHPYPIAIEQAYAAIKHVWQRAAEMGLDRNHIAVAGESSGGNIATVAALMAKERSGPALAGQLLLYPTTCASFDTASFAEFADGPWLTRKAMEWFWDQYLPDRSKRRDPHASPLLAPLDQLAGLPRTLIITAENDVLRDEGEAYGRRLIEAGVETVTTRYNATIHDFLLLNGLANSAPTRAALSQAAGFLRSVFISP